jgi:phosphoribosyl 1,2-cyclic phosphodiesterase
VLLSGDGECTLHRSRWRRGTRSCCKGPKLLEVTSLGSGSAGNALLIRTARVVLFVDCGVGVRRLTRTLGASGLTLRDVDAVLITHEHSDHIRELPLFVARHQTVLCTKGSARATNLPAPIWEETHPRRPVQVADAEIVAIPVHHDAADPCGFLIRTPAGSLTVLTDLGSACQEAVEAIAESRLVVLEANHDEAMLRRGPYPPHLQRRILSDSGHLSNADCGELLVRAVGRSSQLPTVWLAHLSETNNRPQLAKQTVQRHLRKAGIALDLHALPRREIRRSDGARTGVAQLTLDFSI